MPGNLCYVVGLCPFGGVIILSTSIHGLQGTFCNDGSFVLPLLKTVHQKDILIMKYSMRDDLELQYTYKDKSRWTEVYVTENTVLYSEKDHECICYDPEYNHMYHADVINCDCPFTILHFRYYDKYPYVYKIPSIDYWIEYTLVFAIIETVTGRCHSKLRNTSVLIEYTGGRNLSLNRCGHVFSDLAYIISRITVFLWSTDVVSLYSFSAHYYEWHLNMTFEKNILKKDDMKKGVNIITFNIN